MVINNTGSRELGDAFRAAGLRLTPQRLAIIESFAGDETHPTAQTLHERLRERFESLSLATVYNTLEALASIERCRQLDMGGPTRFDSNVEPHNHAVCDDCGAIRDIPECRDDVTGAGTPVPGFTVRAVERIYRGQCAQCAGPAE